MTPTHVCRCDGMQSSDSETCPTCGKAPRAAQTSATRWYLKRANKQRGPHTWTQLRELALRAELSGDDQLMQEGTTRWLAAGTFPSLFSQDETPTPLKRPRVGEDTQVMLARLKELLDRLTPPSREAAPVVETVAKSQPAEPEPMLVPPTAEPIFEAARPEPAPVADEGVETPTVLSMESAPAPVVSETPTQRTAWRLGRLLRVSVGGLSSLLAVFALYSSIGLFTADKQDFEEQDSARIKHDVIPMERWGDEFVIRLNRYRLSAGLYPVARDTSLDRDCAEQGKYFRRHADAVDNDAGKLVCRAEPMAALEQWMGQLVSRGQLLHPELERLGLAFEPCTAGGWVCVLDPLKGRNANRSIKSAVLYPGRFQKEVPCAGYDRLHGYNGLMGFPVSVTFPEETRLKKVQATLTSDGGKLIAVRLAEPDLKRQRGTLGVCPVQPLEPGRTYRVAVTAMVDGQPWRQNWSFTTAR